MGIAAPVMPLASSAERNTISAATSSAVAHREGSAFGSAARFSAVSMIRGSTVFAVIPSRLVSSASDSVQRSSAAFGDLDTTAGRIERFNAIAREEANRAGADWVDLFPLMREQGRLGSFAPDGLHPSAEAYAAWARRLAEIAS